MNLELEMLLKQMNIGELVEAKKQVEHELQSRRKTNPEYKTCLAVWLKYYRDQKGLEYVMGGMDGKSLKEIIKRCHASLKNQKLEPTPELVSQYFAQLLLSINDKWLLDNLTLSLVLNRFNIIQAGQVKKLNDEKDTNQIFDQWN